LDRVLYPYRALAAITGFLGAMAFVLTVSGVFAVLSCLVAQKRKEFGIRMALGAGGWRVTAMVLRQSLRLAALGCLIGSGGALAAARALSRSAYRFDLFDFWGYAAGVLLVLLAAAAASWIPAIRAVRLDPARILRCD
jgi:ABC-type antimicrobial peptide transport system permease subunit